MQECLQKGMQTFKPLNSEIPCIAPVLIKYKLLLS